MCCGSGIKPKSRGFPAHTTAKLAVHRLKWIIAKRQKELWITKDPMAVVSSLDRPEPRISHDRLLIRFSAMPPQRSERYVLKVAQT